MVRPKEGPGGAGADDEDEHDHNEEPMPGECPDEVSDLHSGLPVIIGYGRDVSACGGHQGTASGPREGTRRRRRFRPPFARR